MFVADDLSTFVFEYSTQNFRRKREDQGTSVSYAYHLFYIYKRNWTITRLAPMW